MPDETRVWIAQCLCSQRHCIAGTADEAADETEARRTVAEALRRQIRDLITSGAINPWCGICHAPRESWHFELGRTVWATLEEAALALEKNAIEQAAAGVIFGEFLGVKSRSRH